MTSFKIDELELATTNVDSWVQADPRYANWPVVYILYNDEDVYVGESLSFTSRMHQHLNSPSKRHLKTARVVLDDTFNKSACLDLESFLIRLFAGDGKYTMLNQNDGIVDADYYERPSYQLTFSEIFEELRHRGAFTNTIAAIENSDLFKLSPFKSLSSDQADAVEQILASLFDDLEAGTESTTVVEGNPGTGKTIVAIYLLKMLRDIATVPAGIESERDSRLSRFFAADLAERVKDLKVGLVIPQQSLRASVGKVFSHTSGLSRSMVLNPFEVGKSKTRFDLLVVDEAHRLNQRANQPSAALNRSFAEINAELFGSDDTSITQLDWIMRQSRHRILLVDSAQSVRPADLPQELQRHLIDDAKGQNRYYRLHSQMRVRAGFDYVDYIRRILSSSPPARQTLGEYEFRIFTNLKELRDAIIERNNEVGLSRIVAGYAWPWRSKKDPSAHDIEIDGCKLRWNGATRDWVNSPNSLHEVGSIHTIQGYDLNYAGVIIGNDLRFNPITKRFQADRANYHDAKGKENNPTLGIKYTDGDLCRFILNIYGVLLTRGIMGTYVYVCDPDLREYLQPFAS